MLRRDHLKGIGLASVGGALAVFGILYEDEEEEDESNPPHERNFQDLQDGNWDSNVRFESPVDGLEADVHQVGSMPDGSLETNVGVEGTFQYSRRDTVTIDRMEMKWMMGESAIADEASIGFGNGIRLSTSGSCEYGARYDFDVNPSVSGIRGADTLVLTIQDSDISVSSTC